jgi:predicted phosphodiesterase
MRYMIFGDVHANLDALDAALADGQARGVQAYLFVGDLVGYGPQPIECIERLMAFQRDGKLAWVAGNHELAVRGEIEMTGYNEEAAATLRWTRELLAKNKWAIEFIAEGPLSLQVDEAIWLTHDSLAEPSSGGYHRWPQNAKSELACLRFKKGRVCFYGHTHSLRAEILHDGNVQLAPMNACETGVDAQPLRLNGGDLGWIGTGSVGLPTNPTRQPEFLILDDVQPTWRIEKYRLVYNREGAREKTRRILGPGCGKEIAERIARWL